MRLLHGWMHCLALGSYCCLMLQLPLITEGATEARSPFPTPSIIESCADDLTRLTSSILTFSVDLVHCSLPSRALAKMARMSIASAAAIAACIAAAATIAACIFAVAEAEVH